MSANTERFYIDGVWVEPAEPRFADIVDPCTARSIGRVALGGAADVDRAVKAARRAFQTYHRAKVALEALRGERTVAKLGAKHGVHPTMITAWKTQAVEGMAGVFSGKAEAADGVREGEVEKLHAKIGRQVPMLVVQNLTRPRPKAAAQSKIAADSWRGPRCRTVSCH